MTPRRDQTFNVWTGVFLVRAKGSAVRHLVMDGTDGHRTMCRRNVGRSWVHEWGPVQRARACKVCIERGGAFK